MGDYIKREDVLSAYCKDCCIDCGDSMCADWRRIVEWVNGIPAADVVEIVRCKDCKYGVPTKNGFLNDMIACENKESPCGYSSWLCHPDWFCADGEWREVDDED